MRHFRQNRRVPAPATPAGAQEQRQALGRAARLLAAAADFHDTLRQTLGACLPTVADFGFFDVVVAPGDVRRTVAAHDAPDIEAILEPTRWVEQHHPELNLCALSTGEAALHADTDDAWYRRIAASEAHLDVLRTLGFRSMITVPVRYRDELVGALTLFMGRSGRQHVQADLEFAGELALLAAPVVVNARLVEQHRRAEERLRMATDAGQVGIWDWDITGNRVEWSDRVYQMYGMAPGSETGGLEGFRSRVHPEDWPRVQAAMAAALEGGPPYEVEFRAVRPDGALRWVSTRSHVVFGADGKPARMVGASIDITERVALLAGERQARAEAEAARKRLELLAGASSALANSLDVEDTLRTIATAIVPEVADWCRIDLLDDAGKLQRRIAYHQDEALAERALALARAVSAAPKTVGSMSWCVQHGRSHYGRFDEPPSSDDAVLADYTRTFGMREHYLLPLLARGRTLGAMGVVQAESGRPLTPQDRALIEELARRAALALDNASAYAAAESARKRLALLASASSALANSLDVEDTLRTIAAAVVPAVADWCRIDLLDERGVQQRRISHHSDPARAQQALDMARELQVAPEVEGSMAWCIARREPYHGRFDEPPVGDDPALRRFHEAFGLRSFYIVPLVARGRTLGGMRVMQAESGRDLTEADRALVQELGRRAALALDNAHAYAEAESARRQAEAASRAKDEFLAMLGHELRNPLAPIVTSLELMARREAEAHVQERRIIGRQVTHLSRLIDDLLDVSRITQGKVEFKREPLDLRTVVANAVEQTQPVFERRSHGVVLQLPAQPVMVQGDAVRLTQVLCNLLINAAKFTPADGEIALALGVADGCAMVEVRDSGRGIDADLLPHVFDLFVQGRQPLDRQAGGLGLGLAIVRMIVERHGGSVTAESDGAGHGSRFVVLLPSFASAAQDAPAQPPVAAPAPRGVRLMIVDDNHDAAETLAELLRVVGCEVRCAPDGETALRLLDHYQPQLALLDIGLPGLDGYQLATLMRGDPRAVGMKLVALTGYGRDHDRQRAMQARFDEHLVKPVAVDRLFRTVSSLLGVPL